MDKDGYLGWLLETGCLGGRGQVPSLASGVVALGDKMGT